MKKVRILMAAITVFILITGCKSISKKAEVISINGMIYDTQNRPVVNYTIFADGNEMCSSDIGGRFFIKKIEKGEHAFTGRGNGYLNINENVVINDKEQIIYIRVPSIETKLEEAFSLMKEGRYDKAGECIGEVLEADEGNTDAVFFMSVIEFLEGNKQQAEEYLLILKEKGGAEKYVPEFEKIISQN